MGGIGAIHRGDRQAGLQQHRARRRARPAGRTTRSPRASTPACGAAAPCSAAAPARRWPGVRAPRGASCPPRRGAARCWPPSTASWATCSSARRATSRSRWPCACRGRVVTPGRPRSREAFPEATPHLVVFVHGLMETEFAWRLGSARAGRHLRVAAGRRPRLHAGRRALQHRPPHLRERALALRAARGAGGVLARGGRADRAGGALDGRARGAERLPLRRRRSGARWVGPRAARGLARLAAHGRAARAGRCTWPAPALGRATGDPSRSARSCAAAARASATCATARSWTRTGATAIRDALRAAALTEVPLLEGATHCFVAATLTRSPRHPRRPAAGRRARARGQRLRARARPADPVRGRARHARGRHAPPGAAEPSGGLRAACAMARGRSAA